MKRKTIERQRIIAIVLSIILVSGGITGPVKVWADEETVSENTVSVNAVSLRKDIIEGDHEENLSGNNIDPVSGNDALETVSENDNYLIDAASVPSGVISENVGEDETSVSENAAGAIGEYEYEGTTFLYEGNTITGYKEGYLAADLKIPDKIDGVPVQYLGNSAFNGASSVTSIAIPEGLLSIRSYAFKGIAITELNLPKTVTTLGDLAFADNTSLKKIFVPKSLKSMSSGSWNAFSGCTGLTTVEFEQGITSIPANLVPGRSSITKIDIPGTVT